MIRSEPRRFAASTGGQADRAVADADVLDDVEGLVADPVP
jgi:hypothetical protein